MRGFVYFIAPVGQDGPIKIGYSAMPESRLQGLLRWSPLNLEVRASVRGSVTLEGILHRCFADSHSHFEWFHPTKRLIAAVEAIASGVPLEEAVDLSDQRGKINRRGGNPGKHRETLQKLRRCASAGMSGEEAARKCFLTISTARGYAKKYKINLIFKPVFMVPVPGSRDAEICARRAAGETLRSIGAAYGISHERVNQIVTRSNRCPINQSSEASQ